MASDQVFGAPYYASPEALVGDFSDKNDVWSIGVILYAMLAGRPPFRGDSDNKIMTTITKAAFEFEPEHWAGKSDEVQDLITKLLEKDPDKRLSAKDALQHGWIKSMLNMSVGGWAPLGAVATLAAFRVSENFRFLFTCVTACSIGRDQTPSSCTDFHGKSRAKYEDGSRS